MYLSISYRHFLVLHVDNDSVDVYCLVEIFYLFTEIMQFFCSVSPFLSKYFSSLLGILLVFRKPIL